MSKPTMLGTVMHFRVRVTERDLIIARGREAGYQSTADFVRQMALGELHAPRRTSEFSVPMSADERAEVARRAEAAGFLDVDAYVRARLLGRGLEPLTVSQCIMELRKITGLFKHMYSEGHLTRTDGLLLLNQTRDAIATLMQVAKNFPKPARRGVSSG